MDVLVKIESRQVHLRGQVGKITRLHRKLERDRGGSRQGEGHP